MNVDIDQVERIVIKIGTSGVLTEDLAVDKEVVEGIAKNVAELMMQGKKVMIITSGAVGLGVAKGITDDPNIAASVGITSLFRAWEDAFAKYNIPVAPVLLESVHFEGKEVDTFVRRTEGSWDRGVVVIGNEQDFMGTAERAFKDNDELARKSAQVLGAQLMIYLSTRNKKMNGDHGRGGSTSKSEAITLLHRDGVTVLLGDAKARDIVDRLISGEIDGRATVEDLLQHVQRKETKEFLGRRIKG